MANNAKLSRTSRDQASGLTVLNSWKEISDYLGRSVRTVQRWESELKLPIHRPRGSKRSAVMAIPAELAEWLKRTPVHELGTHSRTRSHSGVERQRQLTELFAQTKQLCDAVLESRRQLFIAVCTISQTVKEIGSVREKARQQFSMEPTQYPPLPPFSDNLNLTAREN